MSELGPGSTASPLRPRLPWSVLRLSVLTVAVVAFVILGGEYCRRASGEQRSRKWLVAFSKALMASRTYYGHFPPAYVMDSSGRRMHSWRAFLIPFIDVNEYSGSCRMYKFDEPWDSPANTQFRNESGFHEYYSCSKPASCSRNASYLCAIGGVVWPIPQERRDDWGTLRCGGEGGGLPSRGKAIFLVEVRESDIPWTEPKDMSLSEIASMLLEDHSSDQFRCAIRNVVTVDATGTPYILDPIRDIDEIKAIVKAEIEGRRKRVGSRFGRQRDWNKVASR